MEALLAEPAGGEFIDRPAIQNAPQLLEGATLTGLASGIRTLIWGWRGSALAGDTAKAGKTFQGFFELWKDADPDIPVLQQAKAEYARLP